MSHYLKGSIAGCLIAGLVVADVHDKGKPHAEYIAVAGPTANSNIAMTNTSAVMVEVKGFQSPPVEWKVPTNKLVIQTVELVKSPRR
jgi:hypothetical protein